MDKFSIVIPVFNEEENIIDLLIDIKNNLSQYLNYFEVIVIDDNSIDNTYVKVKNFNDKIALRLFKNNKNYGQSYSIRRGVRKSKNNIIVTIDGDGQNDPKDILNLVLIYNDKKKNLSLVSGLRTKRKDNLIKIISSKIANRVRSFILKDGCLDTGCSLKVFDKNVFMQIPFFDGLHRFIPTFFVAFKKNVYFEKVNHRPRLKGYSKYGTFDRLFKGIIDLYKVSKMIKNINDKLLQ